MIKILETGDNRRESVLRATAAVVRDIDGATDLHELKKIALELAKERLLFAVRAFDLSDLLNVSMDAKLLSDERLAETLRMAKAAVKLGDRLLEDGIGK